MSEPSNRSEALESVRERTRHAENMRTLANELISVSNRDRASAIKAAMKLAPTKDVAEAAGVSTARLYQLIKDL